MRRFEVMGFLSGSLRRCSFVIHYKFLDKEDFNYGFTG